MIHPQEESNIFLFKALNSAKNGDYDMMLNHLINAVEYAPIDQNQVNYIVDRWYEVEKLKK